MKTLQNNFTTPKQSKILLELGVPADSADGILRHYAWADDILDEKYWESPMVVDSRSTISITELLDRVIDDEYDKALPCWSVGRLIEIYVIARGVDTSYLPIERGEDTVKYLIRLYEEKVKDLDFSKLEE